MKQVQEMLKQGYKRISYVWRLSALASSLSLMACFAHAETLSDALSATYKHSGLLKQNRALLRAADEDVAQAVAATLPVINWSLNATRTTPRFVGQDLFAANLRLSGELTLYDGGANQFAVDAQKEIVLATRQSLKSIEMRLFLRTIEAYVNVRRDRAFVNLRRNNVALIDQEYKAAKERFEVGEVTQTDVALAQARLASAKSSLASAQGNLARSEASYKQSTGASPGALNPVPVAQTMKTRKEAVAYAIQHSPRILEVQHNVSAAEATVLRARAALGLRVTLGGQIGVDQNERLGRQLSLNLSAPIYQGGRLQSNVRQFAAQRDATRASLHVTQHEVERAVADSYAILGIARSSRVASREQIKAATTAFQGVKEEASLGTRTTLDVLNAEQELLTAKANEISARADEILSSYRVLSEVGLLSAEYLQLPIQVYDVTEYYNLVSNPANAPISEQGESLNRVLNALSK